jgi:Aspartyl/Asparaginyl beta-hydroxylase
MLDIPGQPVIDKETLVGGCVRLPLRVDAARLRAEVEALQPSLWGSPGGRVGVQRAAEAVFLRGHAPAEGDLPIEDRPPLGELPYIRSIIETQMSAPPQRCLLARLAAGEFIAPHIDRAPYFNKTIRIHLPVATHARAFMWSVGACYVMQAGEIWALNNCAPHAVWNAHATLARTHLICDFLPTPALLDLLARSERSLGTHNPEVDDYFARLAGGAAAERA